VARAHCDSEHGAYVLDDPIGDDDRQRLLARLPMNRQVQGTVVEVDAFGPRGTVPRPPGARRSCDISGGGVNWHGLVAMAESDGDKGEPSNPGQRPHHRSTRSSL
jgi:hypothetical protein